jgi:hypothetical protein
MFGISAWYELIACAAGGKGQMALHFRNIVRLRGTIADRLRGARSGASPRHPRQGRSPLGSPIRCCLMPSAWRTCLWALISRQLLIQILIQIMANYRFDIQRLTYRRHAPVPPSGI